jgi:hypothetical protein
MKYCAECKGTSPQEALFCINCSAPFAATGATQRLADQMSGSGSAGWIIMPDYHIGFGSAPILVGTIATFYTPAPSGWVCPSCGRSNAPHVQTCPCWKD